MRLVKAAAAKRVPATRSSASACDDTSIAQLWSPASAICRNCACRSMLSGVVCFTSATWPPIRDSTVPSSAGRSPAASSTEYIRKQVVVLPLVPVTPITSSSWLGWP